LDSHNNFSHLSIRDLIEARDQFHVHLMNKKNVIATAIGRYLIRKEDLDESGRMKPKQGDVHAQRSKRTLENSLVIDISWPCVLVFVEQWQNETELLKEGAQNIVPSTIYMPDGRVVPICIVEAPKQDVFAEQIDATRLRFPDNLIGGGFPLLVRSQGVDWLATVGCIVADGHRYYALTNKHVTGEGGELVYSYFGADQRRVGIASGKTLGKVEFSKLYDGWTGRNLMVNCDVGLVEIDDLNRWKTDVVGIGRIGELYDLNTQNLDLSLIAEHKITDGVIDSLCGRVVGCGAVTGGMKGELLAFFYRYKSVGGKEYVSDFLIAGRQGSALEVNHGDSGALWLLETKDDAGNSQLQPIALHWGQHQFVKDGVKSHSVYSLATCLSNVCRELDVELIRDWNLALDYSWGKVGHYTIGTYAITQAMNAATGGIRDADEFTRFMKDNLANISFPTRKVNADIDSKNNPLLSTDPKRGFCPLADVPDIVWKQAKSESKPWGRKGHENPNHYADADAPSGADKKTLFETCNEASKLTTKIWTDYYDQVDKKRLHLDPTDEVSKGLICFRVWQAWDYMVAALKKKNANEFLFAAGVLAHYVGDGCQPLHSSFMSNGDPADNESIRYTAQRDSPATSKHPHKKGDVYDKIVNPGDGVHSAYEDYMIDANIGKILPQIEGILSDHSSFTEERNGELKAIKNGQQAGFAVLKLMQRTQKDIPPHDIVELFKKLKKTDMKPNDPTIADGLYKKFGKKTAKCMARGCLYLASIWWSAWREGKGDDNIDAADLKAVEHKDLQTLYGNPDNLPSQHLDTIDKLLVHPKTKGVRPPSSTRT
jgi:hypothetical protein